MSNRYHVLVNLLGTWMPEQKFKLLEALSHQGRDLEVELCDQASRLLFVGSEVIDFSMFLRPGDLPLHNSILPKIEMMLAHPLSLFVFSPVEIAGGGNFGKIYPHSLPEGAANIRLLSFGINYIPLSSVLFSGLRTLEEYTAAANDWAFLRERFIDEAYGTAGFIAESTVSVADDKFATISKDSLDGAMRVWKDSIFCLKLGPSTSELRTLTACHSVLLKECAALNGWGKKQISEKLKDFELMVNEAFPIKLTRISTCIIGRGESEIIDRCLDSTISNSVILNNTGVGDDDCEELSDAVRSWCKEKSQPFKIIETEWKDDYAAARNDLFQIALGGSDWLYLTDCDETAHFTFEDIALLLARVDVKAIAMPMVMEDGRVFPKVCLIKNEPGWEWQFAYHENPLFWGSPAHAQYVGNLSDPTSGPHLKHHGDGRRSKLGNKNELAVEVLTKLYEKDGNPRHLFFMADAEMNLKKFEAAFWSYTEFIDIATKDGSISKSLVYISRLQRSRIYRSNKNDDSAVLDLLIAHALCPTRAECLGELAEMYAVKNEWALCRVYALACAHAPQPQELEFVEPIWVAWRGLDLLTSACLMLGYNVEGLQYLELLLKRPELPELRRKQAQAVFDELKRS